MQEIRKIGLVGLGRMGKNMMERWRAHGIEVIGYDLYNTADRDVDSLATLVRAALSGSGSCAIWLMLPMEAYGVTLDQLADLLQEGDMIVDGGNTKAEVTLNRRDSFANIGVRYVDVGTSGGIYGLTRGYANMAGCTDEEYEALRPLLSALAPEENGLVHAGPSSVGHFAKMVHNGIEYGIMAALAEGIQLLLAHDDIDFDKAVEILASWRSGSIVSGFLLDATVDGLQKSHGLAGIAPVVPDSGDGQWAAEFAVNHKVPIPVIAAALMTRWSSQGNGDESLKALAAVRHDFGGHLMMHADAVD